MKPSYRVLLKEKDKLLLRPTKSSMTYIKQRKVNRLALIQLIFVKY